MSFTTAVREELAHHSGERPCCAQAEVATALRFGGAFQVGGGRPGVGYAMATTSGAVARRVKTALRRHGGRAEVEVHEAGGLRSRTTYRLVLPAPAEAVLTTLGLLDRQTRPVDVLPTDGTCDAEAVMRGALLVSGSVSNPHADPHLEVRAPSEGCALALAGITRSWGVAGAAGLHGEAWRLTVKSAVGIGTVLARTGAHSAYLRWDSERLRRELRTAANRVANADRANAARVVGAAAPQVRSIEAALGHPGWARLPEELKEVGLARLANPEVSLAELGSLLDPPAGKATVHRRLERLRAAIAGLDGEPLV